MQILGREANQKPSQTPLLQCLYRLIVDISQLQTCREVSSWPQTSTSKQNFSFRGLE